MRAGRLLALFALVAVVVAAFAIARPYIWPDRHGAQTSHFTIKSRYVHRSLGVAVAVPHEAGAGRPLLVFLHNRGADENSEMRNDSLFKELAKLGDRAPVVAFPYGGKSGYWHNRRGAHWERYVMREVIPQVQQRFHTDRHHVAIGGISMGGFGAYDIARRNPGRFCGVGAHSPTIWDTASQTATGAFDDAADFNRNDIVQIAKSKPGRFVGPRLWIDAGAGDPFQSGDRAFVAALRRKHVRISSHLTWKGGHDGAYWGRHWPTYLAFYATALAHCG